jgi:membrane-associated phospholipid phosphatase
MSSDTPKVVCLHDFGISTTGHRPDLPDNSRSSPGVPVIFGSPASGHTLNSVALAGAVAYLLMRRQRRKRVRTATLCCACAFALAMGLSRIYLGDHWLTDVLVAWALGLGWLTVVITAHRLLLTLRRRDAASQPPDPVEPASDA